MTVKENEKRIKQVEQSVRDMQADVATKRRAIEVAAEQDKCSHSHLLVSMDKEGFLYCATCKKCKKELNTRCGTYSKTKRAAKKIHKAFKRNT